jgi:sugar phosphate isomerase/epimerase
MADFKIGIQLYTVRDALKSDFKGTLKKLSEIGYDGVEFAWEYGGMNPRELAGFLHTVKLQAAGLHTSIDDILNPKSDSYVYARAVNTSFVTTSLCGEVSKDWAATTDKVVQAASVAYSQGFTFTYHNHAQEITVENGVSAQDKLLARISMLQFELDTYWIKKGGQEPVSYINKFAGRVPQLHMKDMDKADGSFAEVGQGCLDVKEIVSTALNAGARWIIVEQDSCKRPALESAKISFDKLKSLAV